MSTDKHAFQAETKSLLRLMIHSLYSNKEIFLRELISNASDACDKLRYEAISKPELLGEQELAVEIVPDEEAGTLTIRDTGIGMSRDDLIANLGTIARSGTREFLSNMSGDQAKDAQMIGQFGVGFYAAFIVASKVEVKSLRAGTTEAAQWSSDGEGEFEVADCDKSTPGTEVILYLSEENKEFLEPQRLSFIAKKYSDHIGLPIRLKMDEEKGEMETINQAGAFWTRAKNDLKDEDYQGFYKHLTHDFEDAMCWAHHKVEGNMEYTSLVYIPKRASFELWNREEHHGLKLYVKRVFIMDKAAELLPTYLRFVRGLVDTSDLPLNVSREILQNSRVTDKIKAALVKRVLDMLDDMAKNKPDDYKQFWSIFGGVLKEGLVEDPANSQRIAKLLRMASTKDPEGELTSLEAYVSRMKEDQKSIYFITAETLNAARNSPHIEGFRKKDFEVLLLTDRIDEWVVSHLNEFDGKPLKSVAQGGAELEDAIETAEQAKTEVLYKDVLERAKKVLEDRVQDVVLSKRLTDSPSCLVAPDNGMSRRLEKMLMQGGEKFPMAKPILELNGEHPLVARLKQADEDAAFSDIAEVLLGQAQLTEGGSLEDPAAFVKRLNKMILNQTASPIIVS